MPCPQTGILDSTGNQVVEYTYDAWGNHTVSGSNVALGNRNPIRYRSYFYDTETGLYFLKTRYYDPAVGRFINMDSVAYADPETVNGLNLYAYCLNNPVNNVDPDGTFIITLLSILGTLAIGSLVGGVVGGVASAIAGGDYWAGFAGGALSGLISTFGMGIAVATGGVIGLALAVATSFLGGMSGSVVEQGIENDWGNINYGDAYIAGGISALFSAITFGFTSFAVRNSVGVFENVVDKSLRITTRIVNSLSLSIEAVVATGLFSVPTVIGNGIVSLLLKYL